MMADLRAFRLCLASALREALPDPRHAEWLSSLLVDLLRKELRGQTIPHRNTERVERVIELLRKGRPIAQIARQVGFHRSHVNRIKNKIEAA